MTENNETPASEEAITAKDVLDYVVKQAKEKPGILIVGGIAMMIVGRKLVRSSHKDVEKAADFTVGTIRMYPGGFGSDTYELSVMLKGDELRKAMLQNGLAVVETGKK